MTLKDWSYDEEESGRTETLVQALDKIERLEKQLAIAVEGLERFSECEDWETESKFVDCVADLANDYLKQIKELNDVEPKDKSV